MDLYDDDLQLHLQEVERARSDNGQLQTKKLGTSQMGGDVHGG
jgi:hypothetical protein